VRADCARQDELIIAHVDPRHLVRAAGRPELGHEPAEGPHEGAAGQRGEAAERPGSLADDEGPAPEGGRSQEV